MNRKSYRKPTLISHGDVKSLTKGNQRGNAIDAGFDADTFTDDLTFTVRQR